MMKSLAMIAIALLCALWVVAIAILSIQNVFVVDATGAQTLVSLQFLGISSVKLPLGVALALSAAIGMIVTSLMLAFPMFHDRSVRHKRRPDH